MDLFDFMLYYMHIHTHTHTHIIYIYYYILYIITTNKTARDSIIACVSYMTLIDKLIRKLLLNSKTDLRVISRTYDQQIKTLKYLIKIEIDSDYSGVEH